MQLYNLCATPRTHHAAVLSRALRYLDEYDCVKRWVATHDHLNDWKATAVYFAMRRLGYSAPQIVEFRRVFHGDY